jgi:hypothetical protein
MYTRLSRGKIIVFGIMFFTPIAGVTYQFLHYLIGLRRLGYDPYYIEDPGPWLQEIFHYDWYHTAEHFDHVVRALEGAGFARRWAFRNRFSGVCLGLNEPEVLRVYREADAFLNVTGDQQIGDEQARCPRRIYIEADPFATQVMTALGDPDVIDHLQAHDTHFTYGENIGQPDCLVPIEQFTWLSTRQPVVLDLWANSSEAGTAYRSITTWQNPDVKKKLIEFKGEPYYWDKGREFRKFLDLPKLRALPLELAVNGDEQTLHLLREHGWCGFGAASVSHDLNVYKTFIQQARAEFTVARDQYVRPRTGWFSDRSACYLAAGRPVITQDTGFGKFIPTGRGLFAFENMDDVLAAIDTVESDYQAHSRAAREIATEYFAAEKVLASLLERAGL